MSMAAPIRPAALAKRAACASLSCICFCSALGGFSVLSRKLRGRLPGPATGAGEVARLSRGRPASQAVVEMVLASSEGCSCASHAALSVIKREGPCPGHDHMEPRWRARVSAQCHPVSGYPGSCMQACACTPLVHHNGM